MILLAHLILIGAFVDALWRYRKGRTSNGATWTWIGVFVVAAVINPLTIIGPLIALAVVAAYLLARRRPVEVVGEHPENG